MQRVFDLIEKVASSDLAVLVQGDSGTGKELVARAIHFNGARKRKVFLSENCAAIPESLLESELFGHVRGAFTGAERNRLGLFEQADGGTLFLDEVGDMSQAMQARLLRAVQEGEIRRVGGDELIKVDVRLIAATHRDLAQEVKAGRFREDLFYRLQVLTIALAPLRERPEDIGPLIEHFLERIGNERGRPAPRLDDDARHLLQRYPWPGNVRQLENTLQRLALLAGDSPISVSVLESDPNCRSEMVTGEGDGSSEPMFSFQAAARDQLRRALEAAGGNRDRAARLLGVSRATIYRRIREAGLHDRH
jgi:DNA-binding NtrC family response regulator